MKILVAAVLGFLGILWAIINGLASLRASLDTIKGIRDFLNKKEEFENELVTLKLFGETLVLDIPYKPKRKSLDRAEVAGVLGMYSGGKRYQIPNLFVIYFPGGQLDSVLAGESNELWIPASDAEIEKFQENIAAQKAVMEECEAARLKARELHSA